MQVDITNAYHLLTVIEQSARKAREALAGKLQAEQIARHAGSRLVLNGDAKAKSPADMARQDAEHLDNMFVVCSSQVVQGAEAYGAMMSGKKQEDEHE